MVFLQFPTLTICPENNMAPDTWSFVDQLYGLADGGADGFNDIFGCFSYTIVYSFIVLF